MTYYGSCSRRIVYSSWRISFLIATTAIDGLGLAPPPCYYYSRVDCYRVVVGDDAPLTAPCIRDIQAGFDDGYDVEIVDEGNAQTPDWRRTDAADVVVVVFPVVVNAERGTSQL